MIKNNYMTCIKPLCGKGGISYYTKLFNVENYSHCVKKPSGKYTVVPFSIPAAEKPEHTKSRRGRGIPRPAGLGVTAAPAALRPGQLPDTAAGEGAAQDSHQTGQERRHPWEGGQQHGDQQVLDTSCGTQVVLPKPAGAAQ